MAWLLVDGRLSSNYRNKYNKSMLITKKDNPISVLRVHANEKVSHLNDLLLIEAI